MNWFFSLLEWFALLLEKAVKAFKRVFDNGDWPDDFGFGV